MAVRSSFYTRPIASIATTLAAFTTLMAYAILTCERGAGVEASGSRSAAYPPRCVPPDRPPPLRMNGSLLIPRAAAHTLRQPGDLSRSRLDGQHHDDDRWIR